MKKRIVILLVLTALLAGSGVLWFRQGTSALDPSAKNTVIFVVNRGESLRGIANRLQSEGLIRDSLAFFLLVKQQGVERNIQAGDFRLRSSMSGSEIIEELQHGTLDVRVTIPEGWRNEEIALELAKTLAVPEAEFLKYAREGFMFPDTYLMPREASASAIAKLMRNNFDKKLQLEDIDATPSGDLTFDELIVLASLVEREGKSDADRPVIAGILMNRLRADWPLQVDATLQYALGYQPSEKKWWKSSLTALDKEVDSLYNTYKYTGLPPTPICNPGLASLIAAFRPAETPYYFYLHDADGTIHYAQTNEEHEQNKVLYLK